MTAVSEQEHDRTIEECTEKIVVCPDDVHALSLRGWAWNKKKQYDKAIADFDRALCWDPDRVDALNNRGLAYSGKGKHELAIADFTQAITRTPDDDDLHHFYFNRGRSRRLKGAFEEAIDDFKMAIRLDRQYVKAFRLRGHSWADLGHPRRALADFERAIKIGPGTADDFHSRGNAWVSLGRFRNAIADFTRSIILEPNTTDTAKTYNSRGFAWNRKGRYANVLSDYERAIALDPESPQRRAVLAEFLATCPVGRYRDGDKALKLITEASELAGDIRIPGTISDGFTVVDLVKDPGLDGSLTRSTTPVIDPALLSEDYLGCIACAYAATGDFPSAIHFQRKALDLARLEEDKKAMRTYIEAYEAGTLCLAETPTWRARWS